MSRRYSLALLGGAISVAFFAPQTQAQVVEGVVVTGAAPHISDTPAGQTVTTVDRSQFENTPAFSIGDILVLQPGVTFAQGNGPRDISLSVRGSNARNTFGVRNVQVFEDGFPVTQPDGLARTDLTDPHAYARIDVVQGPSSALYGNYATGGAISFVTRSGRDLDGGEAGIDLGQFGYVNTYGALGFASERFDIASVASHVGGDGFTLHTGFDTSTVNLRATWALGERDRLTFKFIDNVLEADLSIRLSLNQYRANPFQTGCETTAGVSCATVSLFNNGYNGARTSVTAMQSGANRDDRRTIAGLRWEHDLGANTTMRLQGVFDNRDISQPTSATAAIGVFRSYNLMGDITHRGSLFGRDATLFAGAFANYEDIDSYSYNVRPLGGATLGALTQTVFGHHLNAGARARMELALAPEWQFVAGVGYEFTELRAFQSAYTYPSSATPTLAYLQADRRFHNVAPEIALTYTPNDAWSFHARVAVGYGTPQVTQLFVTPAGVPGNNTSLDTQRNIGIDLGSEYRLDDRLTLSFTGFYEFFENELVSQSAGANLLSYTFNAPRSEHRGVEIAASWRPFPQTLEGARFSLSYLYNDQIYTEYRERLSAGSFSSVFDRSGNAIPGVVPNYLNARVAYEQRGGRYAGLGGFVELNVRDGSFLDNANLIESPAYTTVNLNLHYNLDTGPTPRASVFLQANNITDETYVASASNIADSISSSTGLQNGVSTLATSASIYAGSPLSVTGGLRVRF